MLTFGYTKSYVFSMHFTYKLFINELGITLKMNNKNNFKEFDFNYKDFNLKEDPGLNNLKNFFGFFIVLNLFLL